MTDAKTLQRAADTEDSSHPKRGNLLVNPPMCADLLRKIAEAGCVLSSNYSSSSGTAVSADAAVSSSSGGAGNNNNNSRTSSLVLAGATEWNALRSFLVNRVRNVLEVATATMRRQQDSVDDKTTEVYKQQVATLNDFILDNETVVGELGAWSMPMFTIQRLSEILLDPLRFNTSAPAAGDAFRQDASKADVISALAPVLRPDKLQAALRRCVLVAPSQINIGESCI